MRRLLKLFQEKELFLIICATGAMVSAGMGVITPVLPLYGKTFGVGAALVGLLVTSFGVARVVADLPSGLLSDRIDRRWLLAGGALLSGVSSFLCGLATNFWELTSYRFLQGVGSGIYTTSAWTVVVDQSDSNNRGRIMGIYHGVLLIGASLGPAIGGLTAEWLGLRAPFFIFAAIYFFAAGFVYWRVTRAGINLRRLAAPVHSWMGFSSLNSLKRWLSNRNFMLISLITFLIFFSRIGSKMTIIPLLGAEELGLGPGKIGLAITVMTALNVVVLYPAGALTDRWGRKKVIVPSCLVTGAALLLFVFSHNLGMFMLSSVVMGIAGGMAGPAPAAYAADVVPVSSYGITMGLFRTFSDVGWLMGPIVLGYISDVAGYGRALTFNTMLLFVGTALFAWLAQEAVVKKEMVVTSPEVHLASELERD